MRNLLALFALLFSGLAFGGITSDQKFLLNSKMGSVATKVQLGTLIETAETVAPAALSVTTGVINDLAVTTGKLAADAVTNAKIADGAVSLEHLDSGIAYTNMVIQAGTFTTLGGDANESITAASVVATDLVFCQLKTKGGTPRTILTCAANTGTIDVVLSGDPSTDHVIVWQAIRVAS